MSKKRVDDEELDDPDQTTYHKPAAESQQTSSDADETTDGVPGRGDDGVQASPKLPVLGDYVLLGKIGAGGMGKVFKARHRRMDRIVALKVLPPNMMQRPEAVQRFHQEVKAAAQLFHPNIVTAFDAGEQSGVHFLVMEFVDGQPLSSLVKEHGPFSVEKAVDYIQQASVGLQYAHERGMVHRDIKPSNLMLDIDGEVKLLDMGTARYGHQEEGELTKSGVIMGTVNYMSPEQAKDPHSVDHRCDIYSLGCTLYYLLTGKPLYEGDVIQTLMSHANAAIPSISAQNPQVPSWIDTILAQMLAKNPESRYSTLLEFRNDLQEFASGEDPEGTRLMEELHKAQTTQSYPVGMDFGTATCNAAWLNTSNVPQTIVDEEGDSATPSTVLVVDAMDTLIGKRAVLRATKEFDSSADEIKRFLGLINYPGTIAGERYPPPVLAALLLGKLASDVQRTVGHCKQVAVAVPGYFGEVVRAAVQHATQIAGIDLIGLVDETVASALSYFEGQNPPEPKKLVVIDLGAGKLDVAAMMCGEGVLEVQSVGGESRLGGNDFDDLLLDLVSDGLLATYGYDPRMDPMHTRQLMQGCRDAKERLSEVDSIAIQVQIPGKTTRVTISREKFEEIATPLLERLKNILSEVLEAAQFEASQVDSVLLCGGSLGMPMIRELVDQCFPEIEKVSLPHDSVARGAAIYAGIRCAMQVGSATPLRVQSVTGRALGMVGTDVKTGNQVNAIVLPKNTHRPVKVRRILKTHQDNQQNMLVQLIEGESANPDECLVVGKCVVENLPHNLPSKSPIGLVFHYDVHGRLSVEGELDETQKRVQVPVTRDNDLENVDLFRWREWLETVMLCSGM